jgi:hypothetical protein
MKRDVLTSGSGMSAGPEMSGGSEVSGGSEMSGGSETSGGSEMSGGSGASDASGLSDASELSGASGKNGRARKAKRDLDHDKRSTTNRRDAFGMRTPQPAPIEMTVEPQIDEPTWEVRRPGTGKRRLDGRTRSTLIMAAAAAVVVNAGAAWVYWQVTASTPGHEVAGTTIALELRGRSDFNQQLLPGGTGNMTVTLTNDNDFPIRITSVAPGTGNVVADDEHREKGCRKATGVTMMKPSFAVSWEVARNTIGAFTIPDGLRMAADANPACRGATFIVPVQVNGVGAG